MAKIDTKVKLLFEKRFCELTNQEAIALQNYSRKIPFTRNAQLYNEIRGYDCFYNGQKIDKWEAIASGLSYLELVRGTKGYLIK